MSRYCYNCMKSVEDNCIRCPYCGKRPDRDNEIHQLKTGTLLHDRYLVGRKIGQGGFGITYIGLDTILGPTVAIKEYYPNGYAYRDHAVTHVVTVTDGGADLFHHEKNRFLRTLARFDRGPGILTVRDSFEDNNTAYIVMEYLDGENLKHYVESKGKISAEQLFAMIQPIIQTMGKVHKQGIIHLDISPDNIFVLPGNKCRLKQLDFDVARNVAYDDRRSSIVFNRYYAPPEQYLSRKEQGPWTDVYALCATMYYCLTGKVPEEALERCMNPDSRLIPPSALGADITPDQENVILRGMAVKSSERYQSMEELEAAMSRAGAAGKLE